MFRLPKTVSIFYNEMYKYFVTSFWGKTIRKYSTSATVQQWLGLAWQTSFIKLIYYENFIWLYLTTSHMLGSLFLISTIEYIVHVWTLLFAGYNTFTNRRNSVARVWIVFQSLGLNWIILSIINSWFMFYDHLVLWTLNSLSCLRKWDLADLDNSTETR